MLTSGRVSKDLRQADHDLHPRPEGAVGLHWLLDGTRPRFLEQGRPPVKFLMCFVQAADEGDCKQGVPNTKG